MMAGSLSGSMAPEIVNVPSRARIAARGPATPPAGRCRFGDIRDEAWANDSHSRHAGHGAKTGATMLPPDPTPIDDASPRLAELRKGRRARVVGLDESGIDTPLRAGELERRLIEMGVLEGALVEILHEGFPGADPIAVRVDDHVLAMRRAEARAVRVALLA